jgi:hypothetical protein
LSLVQKSDIAAKRKNVARATDDDELSAEEKQALETRALNFALAAAEILGDSTLSEAEFDAQRMLAATPKVFEVEDALVEKRRQIIELVLAKRFWRGKWQWGSPGDACPPESSAVRLLQSMKSYAFAAAHAPLDEELPDGAPPETAAHRETLKRIIATLGNRGSDGAGSSTDALTSDDQVAFEMTLSRVLLFSDVQTAPVAERLQLIQFFDDNINSPLTVPTEVVEIMRTHMRMLFFATTLDMETNDDPDNRPFLSIMTGRQWPVPRANVGRDIFSHVQADLSFQKDESDGVSLLVKTYWEELRKIIYSMPIVGDASEMDVDEEGDKYRETPPDGTTTTEFEQAFREWEQLGAKTARDNFMIKAKFIRMFMRVAAYKDKFGWFAQSGFNLYALVACASRSALWRSRDAAKAAERARQTSAAELSSMSLAKKAAVLKEASKGSLPPGSTVELANLLQDGAASAAAQAAAEAEAEAEADAEEDDEDIPADDGALPRAPEDSDGMDTGGVSGADKPETASHAMEMVMTSVMVASGDLDAETVSGPAASTRSTTAAASPDEEATSGSMIPQPSASQTAASEEAQTALRVNAELRELVKQAETKAKDAAAKAKETEEREAKSAEALEAKEKELSDTKEERKSIQQQIKKLEGERESVKKAAVKFIKDKTQEDQRLRQQAESDRRAAEQRLSDKINEMYQLRTQADDTESDLKRQLSILKAEKDRLSSEDQEGEDKTMELMLDLLNKMTPGLDELRRAALSGPPSDAADEYAERANKDLDAAKKRLDDVKARVKAFIDKGGDFRELLQDVMSEVTQVGQVVKDKKDSLVERAWRAMRSHAAVIWAMVTDEEERQKLLGWAYGIFGAAKSLFVVLAGLLSALRRRSMMGGSLDFTPDETFAGLFTLGSVALTSAQNNLLKTDDPFHSYFFLYRAATKMYDMLYGNAYAATTWLPEIVYRPLYRLLTGNGALFWGDFTWRERATTLAINLAVTGGSLVGGLLFTKALGTRAVLGKTSSKMTLAVARGLRVLSYAYQFEELLKTYRTFNIVTGYVTSFVWDGITYVLDGSASITMMILDKLRIRPLLPIETLASIGKWMAANPTSVLALIALGLALEYSYRKGYLDKYVPTDEQFREFVKRARMLASDGKNKVVSGGGRIKRITQKTFTDAFRSQSDTAGPSDDGSGPSQTVAEDEDDERLPAATAVPPDEATGIEDDDGDDDGAGTGIKAAVAQMAKLKGMKISNPVCGDFVILGEPRKQRPSVSACLVLMLHTDMHGMDR